MNETQIVFKYCPKRTESFLDTRPRISQNSSRKIRIFSFDQTKRVQSKQTTQFFLEGVKEILPQSAGKTLTKPGSSILKSRPGTASNKGKIRSFGKSVDRFKAKVQIPEEQKVAFFGPVVRKITAPIVIKGNTLQLKHQTEENSGEKESHTVEDYLISKEIGKGAYAVVRLAVHRFTKKQFAVKIYDKASFTELNRLKNAYREIHVLQQLSHPNIISMHCFFDCQHYLYLILELISGPSLSDFTKRHQDRKLSDQDSCRIFFQLIQAVSYIHSKNISHRDIKFDNILLDSHLKVRLIDFGFSTLMPPKAKKKLFCGTPSYMAPEIVRREEYEGPPADIWACGVVLFGMVCGYFPFKAQTDKECYKKILTGVVYIPNFVSKGPRELIEKMIVNDPDKRITAQQVLQCEWFRDMGVGNLDDISGDDTFNEMVGNR
jgi:tRNA A-37 threonylcarbamoyl transferase component Bud32